MRVITIKIYFHSGPHPWTFANVTNLTTEGGLLRITQDSKSNQWFPLVEIFRIVETERKETP